MEHAELKGWRKRQRDILEAAFAGLQLRRTEGKEGRPERQTEQEARDWAQVGFDVYTDSIVLEFPGGERWSLTVTKRRW